MRALTRPARRGVIIAVGTMLALSAVAEPVTASAASATAQIEPIAIKPTAGHPHAVSAQASGGTRGSARMPRSEAVVLVGGGGSKTPFVTPQRPCRQGPPAGKTLTPLYSALNRAGLRTYTAPTMPGGGPVVIPTSAGSSSDCGKTLPARYTIDSSGSLNAGGKHLAVFLRYLARSRGVTSFHLVGYSIGGNYARSGIEHLRASHSGLTVRSLSTLGTGWRGVYAAEIAAGDLPISSCSGQQICQALVQAWIDSYSGTSSPALVQSTRRYLDGTRHNRGWNYRQRGALSGIPVTLFGGDYFRLTGASRDVWPNDGSVSLWSALAQGLPSRILPADARRYTFPVVHSQWVAGPLGLPDSVQIPANPAVIRRLIKTITKHLA